MPSSAKQRREISTFVVLKTTRAFNTNSLIFICLNGDVTNTGNGEPGTGVWELMYSGNQLENSKWRSKQKKGSKRNNLGKGEFPPAVPPNGQYVIVRAESD